MDLNEIKNEIETQGVTVNEIIPLKSRTHSITHSYLVSVNKSCPITNVKKIENINNLKISWEKYYKINYYTQCFRCQRFGHSANNCNNEPRCVKCRGKHYYNTCTIKKTDGTRAYCHNCRGDHPANYSKCPILLNYIEQRQYQNQKVNNNNNKINDLRKYQVHNLNQNLHSTNTPTPNSTSTLII